MKEGSPIGKRRVMKEESSSGGEGIIEIGLSSSSSKTIILLERYFTEVQRGNHEQK